MSVVQDKILLLKGKVQEYAWGGYDFIANWLGIENKEHKPFAEYWMGAHPSASSVIVTRNGELSLHQLIHDYPEEFLSTQVRQHFKELPYLFKILDVKDMLSIQVHPTKEAAAKGFHEEEAAGIVLGAPHRNYKDKNHKPEVMIALSDFWLLHGFLPEDKLLLVLQTVPEFASLEEVLKKGSYKALYQQVMSIDQDEINSTLMPLVKREIEKKKRGESTKAEPGWWVAKLFEGTVTIDDVDRGIYSIYFFNIVEVHEGEAVFQGAGIPHAYLEGQNVELMANSDNVLRGGLTPKHVDVPELLKHTNFNGVVPNVMKGESVSNAYIVNYPCPVPDFGINKISLPVNEHFESKATSLEIWVIMKGELNFEYTNKNVIAKKGQAIAILPNEPFTVTAQQDTLIYKAFVPEAE
jgi:mannose-6-phosphate isomerase